MSVVVVVVGWARRLAEPPKGTRMALLRRVAYAAAGIPFVILGYQAMSEPGGRVQAAERFGLSDPEAAVRANGAAMVVGGAALTAGILPRLAAAGLAGLLIPTTLAGHPFWQHKDPAARATQRLQLLKNSSMFGGLLAVAITPRRRRRRRTARRPRVSVKA